MIRFFTIFLLTSCISTFVYSTESTQKVTANQAKGEPLVNLGKDEEEFEDISYEDYTQVEDIQPMPQPFLKPKLPPNQAAVNVKPNESVEDYDEGADFDGDDYFGPSYEGIDSSEIGRGNPRWRNNGRGRGVAKLPGRKPKAPRTPNKVQRRNGRKPNGPRGKLNRRARNLQRNRRTNFNQRSRRG